MILLLTELAKKANRKRNTQRLRCRKTVPKVSIFMPQAFIYFVALE